MLRSVLGRLCTYGLVLAVNAAPLLALAGSAVELEARLAALPDDVPEGDEALPVRWSPLPAFPAPDGEEVDAPEVLTTQAAEPDDDRAAAPAEAQAGGRGEGGEVVGDAGTGGPVAGEGTGAGAAKGDGPATIGKRPKRPSKAGGKAKICEKPHPHVRAGTDGVTEIDRALVDEYTRNLESFMKLGYSRPYDEEGLEGWYISGFSCTSPVAKAGFKRGDVLLSVNGKKTRSWVGVFLLYQKLKNKDDFEVQLVRKGQPVTLRFRVVG
jgi:hypothetical protein